MPPAGRKLAESRADDGAVCGARHPRGFRLLSRAAHAPRNPSARSAVVTPRLLLGLWAAAIYIIYWLGYLRGGS
jgi:hypothetical protein